MREKRKGTRERAKGTCLGGGDKELPLDKEETDMDQRQMTVYKGKRRNFTLG